MPEPICVQGGSADYWTSNQNILTELSNNSAFTGAGGSCLLYSSSAYCISGALYVDANSNGDGIANDASAGCNVSGVGIANCAG